MAFNPLGLFMPLLGVLLTGVIVIVLIVMVYRLKSIQAGAVSAQSFEKLAGELREENAAIRRELAAVLEKVAAVERLMKDV